MKTQALRRSMLPWRSSVLLALLLAAVSQPSAGDHVPYQGRVWGELTIALGLASPVVIPSPPGESISTHFGRGVQIFDAVEFTWTPVGLECAGQGRFVAANGDELPIGFVIRGTITSPDWMVYDGTFSVLGGGTGRFAAPPALGGSFGGGTLLGTAALTFDPSTGWLTLAFEHEFDGTLSWSRGGKSK